MANEALNDSEIDKLINKNSFNFDFLRFVITPRHYFKKLRYFYQFTKKRNSIGLPDKKNIIFSENSLY